MMLRCLVLFLVSTLSIVSAVLFIVKKSCNEKTRRHFLVIEDFRPEECLDFLAKSMWFDYCGLDDVDHKLMMNRVDKRWKSTTMQ